MTDLYKKGNHPDGVRAICPECERVVLKDTEAEAWDVVDDHNKQMHDGEEVAGVCKWDVQSLSEMMPDPDELSRDQLMNWAVVLSDMNITEP